MAVIFLALSISPTGELFNENDSWITSQIKWMKKFGKSYSYPGRLGLDLIIEFRKKKNIP
jgi:hypothetical protein